VNPTSTTLPIVAGAFTLALSAPSLPLPATAGRPAAQAPDTARVVLAEVLFSPAAGDTAFVELANVGSRPADLTAFVLRVDTLDLPLPRLATPFDPGTRILIRFDGQGTTEGSVIHAVAGVVLEPTGGAVALLANDDRVLDRIAWGTADGAIMPAQGGFVPSRMTPGSSFGRPPGANQPGSSSDWVVYLPDQVSPGRPNPLPPVAQLMPLDGAILPASSATLSWYPVAGATRYRIQLAKDTSFAPPLLDQTVEQPSVSTGQLAPGVYRWRVQALGADRVAARWSRPGRLELERPASGGQGRGMGGAAPVTLNVPYFTQHKDSPMLLLESQQSGGPQTAGRSPTAPASPRST
jgi:hypothetical protein